MFTDAWQPWQALLDMSGLWLRWYRMETNIIIHILYLSYQETLMSLRAEVGGGLNLKEMGWKVLWHWHQLLFVCLFVCLVWANLGGLSVMDRDICVITMTSQLRDGVINV